MANLILQIGTFEARVRSIMGGIDPVYLPDVDLNLPDIIKVAEGNIIEIVPNYVSLVDAPTAVPPKFDRTWLEAATVCECAIIACAGMDARMPSKTQGPHVTVECKEDWDKIAEKLAEKRDTYLSRITPNPVSMTYFGTTNPSYDTFHDILPTDNSLPLNPYYR